MSIIASDTIRTDVFRTTQHVKSNTKPHPQFNHGSTWAGIY
ncbi:hypothetical protein R52603_03255 [Paraburkholderia saeva]|uniref:Uncharacterized protein n=1 Tax=Paraburkholderia saeva TaxID=2777537 RepID=A0A9N8S0X9_9BURK|nr:hypothetical protein R70241_00803 [Paraburkholderia saeva]CAG4904843.1 hypothetical protein R52603_03255 [Paraburkholderia saeva]CAG4915884.1 hypothetical protein LMG31841_04528 [Paraburkholderia saeva]